MAEFKKGIPPPQIIRKDFELLRAGEKLKTTNEVQDVLFIQSIEGRAHNGAGVFSKKTYVNTTIDDIVRALNRDANVTKNFRQGLINEILQFAKDVLNGEKREKLMNAHGEPFLGIPMFKNRRVNDRDVLRGMYIGGLRDNPKIRKDAEERYQIKIGCGECHLVNIRVMEKLNLDGEILAHDAHEHEIERFHREGLIISADSGANVPEEDTRYFYIRHRLGPGESDDAAVCIAGILYNTDVALGVFLADAIDTLEKYAPIYTDQDQELAFLIGRGMKELQISAEDVLEFCYLCAIPQAEEESVPDSSLRYLLAMDHRTDFCALESHLNFIEGKPVPAISVSYKHIQNTEFYRYIRKRLVNIRRLDALAVPELSIQDLERMIGEVAEHKFITVEESRSLADVIRDFRSAKAEVIVVVNKQGKVTGTLTATDLIYLTGGG